MTNDFDWVAHNEKAWDAQSNSGENPWCIPVSDEVIRKAREGDWSIILTPTKPVPAEWFGSIQGKRVLCLASGGGQQAPVLAAAGAIVTSYDISAAQLGKDADVAARHGLSLTTVKGDMRDLSAFADQSFDIVVNVISNVFIDDVAPVWRECARVLVDGGRLIAGMMNPAFFLFDHESLEAGGEPTLRYRLPLNEPRDLPPEIIEKYMERSEAVCFSHSLESQIGGQLEAGFVLTGFYEDRWSSAATPLNDFMPTSFATLAIRSPR